MSGSKPQFKRRLLNLELSGSKGAGSTFAHSTSAGSHAGPLLSKSLEVKEPVVRLRIARGPMRDQKVAASMIYKTYLCTYKQNNFSVRTTRLARFRSPINSLHAIPCCQVAVDEMVCSKILHPLRNLQRHVYQLDTRLLYLYPYGRIGSRAMNGKCQQVRCIQFIRGE